MERVAVIFEDRDAAGKGGVITQLPAPAARLHDLGAGTVRIGSDRCGTRSGRGLAGTPPRSETGAARRPKTVLRRG
ncbi:MAG: hypothetical protein IIC36_09375 [Gemmatimonadetes bacterium]|nr:hypothetical protein [Gemmatimonadota bacterium]